MFPQLDIFGFKISVYFVLLSFIFTLMVPLIVRRAKKLQASPLKALDLYLFVLVGSFLGARGMYVLYQEPSFYFQNPSQIIQFWNGGYIFFGGFVGAVLSGSIYCFWKKESYEYWLNFSIPLLSLGYAFGRLVCFLSGCCYGLKTQVLWSVFMHEAYRHPTQLYASGLEFLIFGTLLYIEKRKGFKSFLVLPVWMIMHSTSRALMEVYRDDPRGAEIMNMSVSTFISTVFFILGLAFLIRKNYFIEH